MRPLFFIAFAFLVGCPSEKLPARRPPLDTDGPVDCKPEQFKSKERCFDHAADACASLGCGTDCSIHGARSSKWVVCDKEHPNASSQLVQCGGYSNWLCPEGTVCRDDPAPNACKAATSDDCIGRCVPEATAGPPSPGRY